MQADVQRRPLFVLLFLLLRGSDGSHTPSEKLAHLSIPACARAMMANTSFERHYASAGVSPMLAVDHVYVVHYTGNVRRGAYQKEQLAKMGVDFSLVTGYDRDFLDGHDRACMLTTMRSEDIKLPDNKTLDMHMTHPSYVSQVIKLYGALYDMLSRDFTSALIMEDDAVVKYENVPSLSTALRSPAAANFTIVYSGSYNPKGTDGLRAGFYPKDEKNIPGYRGPGRMMPAAGCVLSVAGAAHLLENLPIRAPLDMTLSDWRVPAAPKHRSFVFKPFAFVPGAFGTAGIFGGEGITTDIQTGKAKAAPGPGR